MTKEIAATQSLRPLPRRGLRCWFAVLLPALREAGAAETFEAAFRQCLVPAEEDFGASVRQGEPRRTTLQQRAERTPGVDPKTADLIDTDKDGRIRPPEIIAAVQWAAGMLKDVGHLMKGGDSVPLTEIADASALAGAKRILASLKKTDATAISLAEVTDTVKIFAETKRNGDGVIIAETADDAGVRKAIEDVIAALGPVTDRSGKPGVNQANVDRFFAEAQTLINWSVKGEADKTLTPLGLDGTAAASVAIKAVKAKVDDYFARCRLAAFDAVRLRPSTATKKTTPRSRSASSRSPHRRSPRCRLRRSKRTARCRSPTA